jgi:flagellar hook-associated protein 2
VAGISFSGVGSGLDLASLLNQLIAAERSAPAARFDRAQGRAQTQLSALGTLKSALAELRTANDALKSIGSFQRRTATSGDESLFTALAEGAASPGAWSVEVQSLAKAHKLASGAFASASAVVGTGTLTLAVGAGSFSVNIDSGNNTLAGIRDAINAAADNAGVRAGIITADDGAHLVLTSTGAGSAHALTVTRSGGDGGLDALVYQPGVLESLLEKQPADDAVVVVDGFTHTGSSNAVTGIIPGVTLNLVAAEPGTTTALTIGHDREAVKAAVTGFVAAYNKVVQAVRTATRYDAATRTAAPLAGDALPRSLTARLREVLGGQVSGLSGALDTLVELGVKSSTEGTLVVDETQLSAALDADYDSVKALFTGAGGFATVLDSLIDEYLDAGGLFKSRETTLTGRLDRIADQREALERRLDAMEARLRAQFTALDGLIAQMNSTSQFLSQQIAGMNRS